MRSFILVTALVAMASFAVFKSDFPAAPVQAAGSVDRMSPAVREVFEAEQIENPLERCLKYPSYPGFDWPEDLVVTLCQQIEVRNRAWDEFVAMEGDPGRLESHAVQQLDRFSKGEIGGYELNLLYNWFEVDTTLLGGMSERWLAAFPDSPHARLARATYLYAMATYLRRARTYSDIGEDDRGIFEAYLDESFALLKSVPESNPQLIPAYVLMLDLALQGQDDLDAEAIEREATKIAPHSYNVRNGYAWTLFPRWGGDMASLEAYVEKSLALAENNPKLKMLAVFPQHDRAATIYRRDGREQEAILLFDAALQSVYNAWTMEVSAQAENLVENREAAFLKYSQVLRFQPWRFTIINARANTLDRMGFNSWADAERQRIIESGIESVTVYETKGFVLQRRSQFPQAIEAYQRVIELDPDNIYAHREIGRITVYRTRDFDTARPHIDFLLEHRPRHAFGWLLQADYLHDKGASDQLLDEALFNYLKYVNREDPANDEPVRNIEAYLKSQNKLQDFNQRIAEEQMESDLPFDFSDIPGFCVEDEDKSAAECQDWFYGTREDWQAMQEMEAIDTDFPGPEAPDLEQAVRIDRIEANGDLTLADGRIVRLAGLECDTGELVEYFKFRNQNNPEFKLLVEPTGYRESTAQYAYLWEVIELTADPVDVELEPFVYSINDAMASSASCSPVEQADHGYYPRYQMLSELHARDG